ncbi:MAG: hypothetical protein ACD_45C00321G0001 [uncultured bacterium]|nr:MAG: hypothetical protein ACD_45C00321G0001 [uncultured bacterium]
MITTRTKRRLNLEDPEQSAPLLTSETAPMENIFISDVTKRSDMQYIPIPEEPNIEEEKTIPLSPKNQKIQLPNQVSSVDSGKEKKLSDVVTSSTLANEDFTTQTANIVNAFNKNVTQSCFVTSMIRGERLNPGEVLLGHRNQTPELALFNNQKIALESIITGPNTILERTGKHKINSPFYGAHGSYVVNVPRGQYAKAMLGNKPILLDEGPHVIHDPLFSFDPRKDLIKQASPYIQHGTIYILRVPAGSIAKIWIGSTPYLLEARDAPYVFNTPLFKLDSKKTQDKEDKEEKEEEALFENAAEKSITHGSLKRIIPRTGEVAITYNQGELTIIDKPILITSPMHNVDSFLDINTKTLLLPSEGTKTLRLKENPKATPDEIAYEIFQTADRLIIGVKLCVVYHIHDAKTAIKRLGKAGIVPHIESLATADMANAIQQSNSSTYLSSYSNKPNLPHDEQKASAPSLFSTIQDGVRDKLAKHLDEYGITLVQLRFETPKIMNTEIGKKMEEQSLLTAQTHTKKTLIDQQTDLATKQADQEAQVQAIVQKQKNESLVSAATAKLNAAKIEAKALLEMEKAKQQAGLLQARVLKQSRETFQLELARIQAEGLRNARVNLVIGPPGGINPFQLFSGSLFSGNLNNTMDQQSVVITGEHKLENQKTM